MNNKVELLWNNCLKVIKDNVSDVTFNTWFAPIVPLLFEDNVFTIQVPSQFFYEYLEDKFIDLLRMTLHREIGEKAVLNYRILVENTSNTHVDYRGEAKSTGVDVSRSKVAGKVASPFQNVAVPADFDSQLNPKYTFDNFFEGVSNKLARTAGETVAKNPGKTAFSPLFVHGVCGVGKTHLCHAIGVKIKELYPEKRVLYVSAHLFKIQYTDATRFNTVNDFINFYQGIDVLIIDDIHELSGLEKTQNTFFHIFNHLHQNNKQLILTSDRCPSELLGVEERLLTRFRWGLTTRLEAPDYDLRIKLLQSKVLQDGLSISDDVIEYVAENVVDNIRDLEGVIVSLMAHSVIYNRDVDLSLAKRVIGQAIKKSEKKSLTAYDISEAVCNYFNIKKELIHTASRKREIVQARQVAMYLTKQYTDLSLAQIGSVIGKKNHATVLHACRTVKDQIEVDKSFRDEVEEIEKILKR
ncbi:chromosomal replication initiator protein [Dysgonomonas sp. PH5-45]|uniref:chromosomal replication initiator protein DnaA n=1 Tax=unclassified Dysgonomonas TaxID=2630389 RepID=UPI002475B9DC|nr:MULTISPECIES: chromosomal replication initiator protein DnaA [unclassified Dysgonomonas]MDH6354319.1 chromosomal replication initiator protein [Dysgonomonas sp. PH5-45]MDH6387219.1 chromosomal replication initiator protein [Dysgonomonas sp. PH5-37]